MVASFKTEKTLRLHDGLGGMMGIRDQMCALENLRVWEEEETGGVLALIHYSALFCSGYMKFYLNDARYPLVIKDDAGRTVEVTVVAGQFGDATPLPPPPDSWASQPM